MTEHAIPCLDVIHQLWDYLDGELSPERAAGIREHLETCAGCRAVSEFERSFRDAARALLSESLTESLDEAEIRARVVKALSVEGYRERQ